MNVQDKMERAGEEAVAGQEASARAGAGVRGRLQQWQLPLALQLTPPAPSQT